MFINILKVCSWNISRGLIKREQEIKELINKHELNITFLVEADNSEIEEEKDYKLKGLTTIVPMKKDGGKIRIRTLTL